MTADGTHAVRAGQHPGMAVRQVARAAEAVACGIVLLLPVFLVHLRVGAEIGFDVVAVLFLIRSALDRRWLWVRRDWVVAGLLWWAWTAACTVYAALAEPAGGWGHVVQAFLVIRFLVFAAALEQWVLRDPRVRRWLLASFGAVALYVAGQSLLQFATGRNLFGNPRWVEGELTGPFNGPKAAPTFIRVLFPAMLPAVSGVGASAEFWRQAAAGGILVAGMAVVVLIGQRMPVLLAGLGLLATGLLMPKARGLVMVAVVAAGALIGASAVVSPPTFYRLVTKFTRQIEDFPDSPYGQITARALAMAGQHPWAGLGFNGFQANCEDPRYQHGWRWPEDPGDTGGGAEMCVTHPHSFYLQALTDAGVPGLIGFSVLVVLWLRRLSVGLWRAPDPLRVGLFVAALIQLWPISTTSPLVSLPMGGWFFLVLGFGLAAVEWTPPK
jgi:O-antigen ligase